MVIKRPTRLCLRMSGDWGCLHWSSPLGVGRENSIATMAKESIDVPPHSRLRLRAVGSGDQVYDCVNGRWTLKAPDAKLLNQEGSVIGRHFAGPTWQLNDGSWVKAKAIAKQVAPDATALPWLLLESV